MHDDIPTLYTPAQLRQLKQRAQLIERLERQQPPAPVMSPVVPVSIIICLAVVAICALVLLSQQESANERIVEATLTHSSQVTTQALELLEQIQAEQAQLNAQQTRQTNIWDIMLLVGALALLLFGLLFLAAWRDDRRGVHR